MSRGCARCDFHADDLTDHAVDSGHPLCIVCRHRSLTEFEPQTCQSCIGRVRADLTDLVEAYTLLDPHGIVGLTLLGDGTMQRHAHDYELRSLDILQHPLADDDIRPRPIRDEWPTDPLPVVAALASWEDFWRADFADPTGPAATLVGVVGYLNANLDTGHRAAQTHPAFDEFATQVHQLRSDIRQTVGLADVPVQAKASCFDCGGPLLRTFAPPATSLPDRRVEARRRAGRVLTTVARQRDAERSYGITTLTPWPVGAARRAARRAMLGTTQEGAVDDWTCGWCRRVYDQAGYFLALRAAASSWVPVPLAAETARRSVWTVRSWMRRLQVASACRVSDRTIVVWWPDVSERAFRHADGDAALRESG